MLIKHAIAGIGHNSANNYVGAGVLFNGTVGIRVNGTGGGGVGLNVTDTPYFMESLWLKARVGTAATQPPNTVSANIRDIASNKGIPGTTNSETVAGANIGFDDTPTRGRIVHNGNDSTHLGGGTHSFNSTWLDWTTQNDIWTHLFRLIDTAAGRRSLYVAGSKKALTAVSSAAVNINLSNGLGWGIAIGAGQGAGGSFGYFAVMDYWLANGAEVSGLIDGTGGVSAGLLAKFIDGSGNPVDLGATGSNPTGVQPAICLTGGKAGWQTNKGYAGTVSFVAPTTGATLDDRTLVLTGLGAMTGTPMGEYPSSPGGRGGKTQIKWASPTFVVNGTAGQGTAGVVAHLDGGFPIAQGDQILCIQMVNDLTLNIDRTALSPGPGMLTPNGWVSKIAATHSFPGSTSMNMAAFSRIMDISDVNAASGDWARGAGGDGFGGPPTLFYCDNATTARQISWQYINVGSARIQDVVFGTPVKSATPALPTVNPSVNTGIYLAVGYWWNGGGGSPQFVQPPTGTDLLFACVSGVSTQSVIIAWKDFITNAAISGLSFNANASQGVFPFCITVQ